MKFHDFFVLLVSASSLGVSAQTANCHAQSGAAVPIVLELYTSEACSSCPPADQWLSTLKGQAVVAQAFHVAYWDDSGWADRFAAPAHAQRQRQIAALAGAHSVYTPQLVRNAQDWTDYTRALTAPALAAAAASIELHAVQPQLFEALVTPVQPGRLWSAYWTVTEDGHQSRVRGGENAGRFLQHDFVVRQYIPLGPYRGAQALRLHTVAPDAAHPRHVNLVVFDPAGGQPLQALSLACPAS